MAKVLFIIPKTQGRFGKPSTPHVGVSYLAGYIRHHGHEPKIIDLRVQPHSLQELKQASELFRPDFIGITSVSLEYLKTYEFINAIASWGVPVIYGGPHVSTVREEIFKGCTPFAAVYGEGEEKLLDIISGKPLSEITGIMYKDENGAIITTPPRDGIHDLDSIPFPAYELSDMPRYSEKKIPLTTSRECPYSCTYCNVKLVMGKGFRKRSAENVVAEIEKWHKKGYTLFGINDDTFTSDMKRAARICELIIDKKIKITWELRTGVRVDRVDEPLLRLMKRAGCHFLAFGIESIDDEILVNVKKGIVFDQVKKALAVTEKIDIPFSGFFMIGLPGDSFDKFLQLYAFARKTPFNEVRFYNLEPYPHTEVYDWVKNNGTFLKPPEVYLNDSTRLQSEPVFETKEFTRKQRMKAYDMGEALMVKLLLRKTLGKSIGITLSPLCDVNPIRKLFLALGFRFTSFVRRLQEIQHLTMSNEV